MRRQTDCHFDLFPLGLNGRAGLRGGVTILRSSECNRDDRMGSELDFGPWFRYLRGRMTSRMSMIFNFFAFNMN